MALLELQPLPPVDQLQKLEAMLTELMPAAPKGVAIITCWTLWVTDEGSTSCAGLQLFQASGW